MNWQGKRVIVTGAGGFIGSHLCEHLQRTGANITGICRYTSTASRGWLRETDIPVAFGDVSDGDWLRRIVADADIVFHLAALIGIPYSYEAPCSYLDTNLNSTAALLRSSVAGDIARLVVTSTSEVYGTARYTPMDESHPLQAQSPYAASKIAADALVDSFARCFNAPVVTVRPFNTYGPRQSTRAVLPTIIQQMLQSHAATLGNLDAVRDMNYVADTVAGFMACGYHRLDEVRGQVFNFSSGRGVTIQGLVDIVAKQLGIESVAESVAERMRPDNSEVRELIGNSARARHVLGWQPEYSLEEGVAATIEWCRSHLTSTGYAV